MASERYTVLQAARALAKAWCASTPLTDAQVIKAYEGDARPALPYIAVHVTSSGSLVAHDETVWSLDESGDPTYIVQGERRGVVAFHAYGIAGEEWLENLVFALHDPVAIQQMRAAGVMFTKVVSGVHSLPRNMNSEIEDHFVLELEVDYRASTPERSSATVVPLEHTDIDSPGDVESDEMVLDMTVDAP